MHSQLEPCAKLSESRPAQAGTGYGYGMAAIVRISELKGRNHWIHHSSSSWNGKLCEVPLVSSDSVGKMKRREASFAHDGIRLIHGS